MGDLRLFVDLQAAQSKDSGHRGLGRYGLEFTRALLKNGAPLAGIGLSPDARQPDLGEDVRRSGLITQINAATLDRLRAASPLAYQILSPMEGPYDIEMILPRCLERADAVVMVVFDLIPLLFADPYLMKDNILASHVARLRRVKTADLLLAISERTRLDFIEHLGVDPDRIYTIGTGASEHFALPEPGADPLAEVHAALPDITGRYIMCVPAFEWRKNAELLIRAYARSDARRERQLVLACSVPPTGVTAWRALAHEVGLDERELVITGFVDDRLLRLLYQATDLNVFPSKYEGFGLPVIEAARCGAASISSDRGSLPEVLDLPASTFDAEDPEALTDLIDRAVVDGPLRRSLLDAAARAATRHTWDHVAQRAMAAYERLDELALRRARPRRRRPKVAIVGPMPPVASGVAVYTQRAIAELDLDRIDLDVYAEAIEPGQWPPRRLDERYRLFSAAALGTTTNPHDYDALVYCLGASRFHIDTFERARKYPGIVWAHDVNSIGLLLEWAERVQWEERYGWRGERRICTLNEILAGEHARTHPGERATALDSCVTYDDYVATGLTFARSVAQGARRLVVNSELARELFIAEHAGATDPLPPIDVIPHAVPRPPLPQPAARRDRPVVVSLGFTVPRKRPLTLVDAVARLSQPVDLVFVGSCTPESLRHEIEGLAARLGMADRVTITDYVDEESYHRWLSVAACSVQLREVDFGESTGTVHDAIAARVPTVTSVRSCAELPAGTVTTVAPDVTADALAAAIERLVFDAAAAAKMRQAQEAYAASWTFAHVARRLAEVIDDALPAASRPFLLGV